MELHKDGHPACGCVQVDSICGMNVHNSIFSHLAESQSQLDNLAGHRTLFGLDICSPQMQSQVVDISDQVLRLELGSKMAEKIKFYKLYIYYTCTVFKIMHVWYLVFASSFWDFLCLAHCCPCLRKNIDDAACCFNGQCKQLVLANTSTKSWYKYLIKLSLKSSGT